MKKLHLFKDYQFVHTLQDNSPMMAVLNAFQRNAATTTPTIFTVLNPAEGYAFSQRYERNEGPIMHGASWGTMFKHEAGAPNPEPIPSYDDLLRQVPQPPINEDYGTIDCS